MQSVAEKTLIQFRHKRGIGIIEVMVAALVLGILYAAVSNLQKGNRDALLRIRARDGATEVAQNIIDSLGALGLANFTNANLIACTDDGGATIPDCYTLAKPGSSSSASEEDEITVVRTWKGQPGIVTNNMSVTYTVKVRFSGDDDYKATTTSQFMQAVSSSSGLSHVFAKRVDVTVSWPFKNSRQSISVSGVIR